MLYNKTRVQRWGVRTEAGVTRHDSYVYRLEAAVRISYCTQEIREGVHLVS